MVSSARDKQGEVLLARIYEEKGHILQMEGSEPSNFNENNVKAL
jgi:hypothetical protein